MKKLKDTKKEDKEKCLVGGSAIRHEARFVITLEKKHTCPYCKEELTTRPWGRVCENLGCNILHVEDL